jgi:hypothetical protein
MSVTMTWHGTCNQNFYPWATWSKIFLRRVPTYIINWHMGPFLKGNFKSIIELLSAQWWNLFEFWGTLFTHSCHHNPRSNFIYWRELLCKCLTCIKVDFYQVFIKTIFLEFLVHSWFHWCHLDNLAIINKNIIDSIVEFCELSIL